MLRLVCVGCPAITRARLHPRRQLVMPTGAGSWPTGLGPAPSAVGLGPCCGGTTNPCPGRLVALDLGREWRQGYFPALLHRHSPKDPIMLRGLSPCDTVRVPRPAVACITPHTLHPAENFQKHFWASALQWGTASPWGCSGKARRGCGPGRACVRARAPGQPVR